MFTKFQLLKTGFGYFGAFAQCTNQAWLLSANCHIISTP